MSASAPILPPSRPVIATVTIMKTIIPTVGTREIAWDCKFSRGDPPPSAAEIDRHELGEKVVPKMEVLSCYKTSCDFVHADGIARRAYDRLLESVEGCVDDDRDPGRRAEGCHQVAESR